MPEYPKAWLQLDAAAVSLGVATDQAQHYAKVDGWRTILEGSTRVYAIEDVRATAKSLAKPSRKGPIVLPPAEVIHEHRDNRRGPRLSATVAAALRILGGGH